MILSDIGINWCVIYSVEWIDESDRLIVIKKIGDYHRFDEGRTYPGTVDKYVACTGNHLIMDGIIYVCEVK